MATCFLLWLCTTCLVLWQLLAHQTWNTRKCRFHITWFQISKLSPSLPNWLSCLYSRWEHKIEQATVRIRCFTGYCERLAIIKSFPMYTPCNLVFKIVYLSPNLIIFKLWWQIWVIYLKICLWLEVPKYVSREQKEQHACFSAHAVMPAALHTRAPLSVLTWERQCVCVSEALTFGYNRVLDRIWEFNVLVRVEDNLRIFWSRNKWSIYFMSLYLNVRTNLGNCPAVFFYFSMCFLCIY